MKNNRIFVGPGNIAGGAMYIAKSLRIIGINAKSFSYRNHPFGYPCDYENILMNNPFNKPNRRNHFQKLYINKYSLRTIWGSQKLVLFTYALFRFDTFIFISHETFFTNNNDLWLLKLLGKKIAFLFMGCPERDPRDIINQTDGGFCSFCRDKEKQKSLNCYNGDKKRKKIEKISKYANIIFAHRDTTSFIQDKNKIKTAYCITDLSINKKEIINKYKKKEEIFISHLPSNTLLKGTYSVLKAINNIREKGYKFQFFSDRINHSKVNDILKRTHILIDQFSYGHGLLAVEGMANGCVVVCRTAKWFKADFPELPLVSCEPEELTEVLVDLIKNPEKMFGIALKSYQYYNKFHSPEVVGYYYKDILQLK